MPRYKLVIEYDGGPFCGWQRQADQPTVQAAIEAAVLRFSGEDVRLTCAGRTDAGVHAIHQVAHLDLAKPWRTDTVRDAVNAHLRPQPVAVLSAEIVAESFDARHSAIRRHYRYRILNRRSPAALTRDRVWQVPWRLDAASNARGKIGAAGESFRFLDVARKLTRRLRRDGGAPSRDPRTFTRPSACPRAFA